MSVISNGERNLQSKIFLSKHSFKNVFISNSLYFTVIIFSTFYQGKEILFYYSEISQESINLSFSNDDKIPAHFSRS